MGSKFNIAISAFKPPKNAKLIFFAANVNCSSNNIKPSHHCKPCIPAIYLTTRMNIFPKSIGITLDLKRIIKECGNKSRNQRRGEKKFITKCCKYLLWEHGWLEP